VLRIDLHSQSDRSIEKPGGFAGWRDGGEAQPGWLRGEAVAQQRRDCPIPAAVPIGPAAESRNNAKYQVSLHANRSAARNVHIYDARDPDTVLGGLILTNGVINAQLLFDVVDIHLYLRPQLLSTR
jgi:hypothetical protein